MRITLLATAMLCTCLVGACGDDRIQAHPIYLEVTISGGDVHPPCAQNGVFEGVSTRDTALTANGRKDQVRKITCIAPVDAKHERLLLYGVGCSLRGTEETNVSISAIPVDGASMFPIELVLTTEAPVASRTFGPGMPLLTDLELGSYDRGRAQCWVSGLYVRTTDSAKLWDPRVVVSRTGRSVPNPDRR